MHLSVRRKSSRLPARFPVGTTYVVEGRGDKNGQLQVLSRYVVFPGGRRVNLANDSNVSAKTGPSRRRAAARQSSVGPRRKAADHTH